MDGWVLDAVYREHRLRVRRLLRRRGITDDALDDVTHDAFLAIHRRLPQRDPEIPLTQWLVGVVRNVAFSHRRGRGRREALAAVGDSAAPVDPEAALARDEAVAALQAFVDGLEPQMREVFVRCEILGATVPEVVASSGAPLKTSYSRLRIARARFSRFCASLDTAHDPRPAARLAHRSGKARALLAWSWLSTRVRALIMLKAWAALVPAAAVATVVWSAAPAITTTTTTTTTTTHAIADAVETVAAAPAPIPAQPVLAPEIARPAANEAHRVRRPATVPAARRERSIADAERAAGPDVTPIVDGLRAVQLDLDGGAPRRALARIDHLRTLAGAAALMPEISELERRAASVLGDRARLEAVSPR